MHSKVNRILLGTMLLLSMVLAPALATAAPAADAAGAKDSSIVVANSAVEFDALRARIQAAGGVVRKEIRDANVLVIDSSDSVKASVKASGLAKGVAKNAQRTIVNPTQHSDFFNAEGLQAKLKNRVSVNGSAAGQASAASIAEAAAQSAKKTTIGDPAFDFPGLMWSIQRIHGPEAWDTTTGSGAVRVGVADTGLDFTHSDLGPRIVQVVDFSNPQDCIDLTGFSDADLAAIFGGPEKTDWNGHGSWIGGNIAGALNGAGVNGIAPKVKLVSLKISGWCGSTSDATILDAFVWASNHNVDIVSISFGGYLDLSDPDQALVWATFVDVVSRARVKGTTIIAAAGNEHVRIGPAGQAISHGILTTPGTAPFDLFGFFEVPGGIPGVVDVSSTGNFVAPSNPNCAPDTIGRPANPATNDPGDANAVCKPTTDTHQAAGTGRQNQLSYFSNYGPRIDVAGPGGARKFNLPNYDRGGTPGFPYTASDLTLAFEDFSTTSNWALEIPCFVFTGNGFPNDCYSTIQGTSMATPHASGVAALILSQFPDLRNNSDKLVRKLKNSSRHISGNATKALSATDMSPGDLSGIPCAGGYCHLEGPTISDADAYGSGLVDAQRAVH